MLEQANRGEGKDGTNKSWGGARKWYWKWNGGDTSQKKGSVLMPMAGKGKGGRRGEINKRGNEGSVAKGSGRVRRADRNVTDEGEEYGGANETEAVERNGANERK